MWAVFAMTKSIAVKHNCSMNSTLTRSVELEIANAQDILTILRQNYGTWSAGLNQEQYRDFMQAQLQQPWSRSNFRYLVARNGDAILSSCKLYTFDFQSRGQVYKVGGIGAVFTPENERGKGHAIDMLESVIDLAEDESFDALLLFSDIDPLFYERLGFELLPDNEFHIWTNTPQFEEWVRSGPEFVQDLPGRYPELSPATEALADDMVSHYRRYLPTRPYGLVRNEHYWRYKLNRSLYRCHIVPNFPALEVLTLDLGSCRGGYAMFEEGGQILRVLEVIGSEETRARLWRQLLRTAVLRGVHLVRGWEAAAPDFQRGIRYMERSDWARPMLLPLNEDTDAWLDLDCCPLLELDHF